MKLSARATWPFILFGIVCASFAQAGALVPTIISRVEHAFTPGATVAIVAIIAFAFMSALSEYFGRSMRIEAFVLAIFLGVAGQDLLAPLASNGEALTVVVNVSAAIILLQGGLEIKFENFKKLFAVIGMLSLVGLFTTAVFFSFTVLFIAKMVGVVMLPHVALLLGAILASTDPAALVPLFKKLNWIDETARDVIIAESAGTDVTGTILTLKLLGIVSAVGAAASFSVWNDGYAHVLTLEAAEHIGLEMLIGAAAGYVGYVGLLGLEWLKKRAGSDHGVDALAMKVIGVASFFLAYVLHGSGFLAVFVAGLLYNVTGHMKSTEHKVGDYIDALFKPAVFVTLGSIVDIDLLLQYAPLGILAGLAFMFVNRPAAVLASLLPFRAFSAWAAANGKRFDRITDVSWKDMAFIASVRETGAIPAVLLLAVKASGIVGADMLVSVGTWVILLTLVFGPMYKPLLAEKFGIAKRA
ncbi:MAG: hypothetical protein RLZZ480_256 [Candidatus Parcubacteria bacterium]|jgi:NhaP-type Na+/H+ or K+/H+ antiporter